jgi:hypothetical protein
MDFGVAYEATEGSRGFGAIQHVTANAGETFGNVRAELRVESKTRDATATSGSLSGNFVEAVFSVKLSDSMYSLTRIGKSAELRLFVDNSIYQEIGMSAGKLGSAFVDANVGIGSRKFSSGTEKFVNLGPTFSWATGALWLRREQSLDGGGYRHVVSLAQWATPALKFDVGLINEHRRKFTLPVAGAVGVSDVEASRASLAVSYSVSPAYTLTAKTEKVVLKRAGFAGNYYDPASFGVGLNIKY